MVAFLATAQTGSFDLRTGTSENPTKPERTAGLRFANAIFRRHADAVLTLASHLLGGDGQRATDLTRQTFEEASREAQQRVETRKPVRSWLLALALRKTRDAQADRGTQAADRSGSVPVTHAAELTPGKVAAMLSELPPAQRAVFMELYFNGRSVSQAAKHLGISLESTKLNAYHAMRTLRVLITSPTPIG